MRLIFVCILLATTAANGALVWKAESDLLKTRSETSRLGRAAAIFDRAMQSWWDNREYEIDLSTQNWGDDREYQDV